MFVILIAAKNQRNDADQITIGTVKLVVNPVKGDPEEGEHASCTKPWATCARAASPVNPKPQKPNQPPKL